MLGMVSSAFYRRLPWRAQLTVSFVFSLHNVLHLVCTLRSPEMAQEQSILMGVLMHGSLWQLL